jgi:predicted nucleotidyltransferase
VIPELIDGMLPEGIHPCTMEEVNERFGRFLRSDRRIHLTASLREFVGAARESGIVAAIVIDGSYVTRKEEPGDIDLIVALKPGIDTAILMRPFEYNVQSQRMVKQIYRFDIRVAEDGSTVYDAEVRLFTRIRTDDPDQATSQLRKGLLRVEL